MTWERKLNLYVQVVRSYIFSLIRFCYCKRYLTFSGGAPLLPCLMAALCKSGVRSGDVGAALPPMELHSSLDDKHFSGCYNSFGHLHLPHQYPAKIMEHKPLWRGGTECATDNSYTDPEWDPAFHLPCEGFVCRNAYQHGDNAYQWVYGFIIQHLHDMLQNEVKHSRIIKGIFYRALIWILMYVQWKITQN